MKFFTAIFLTFISLHAGFFDGGDEVRIERLLHQELQEEFRRNVGDANAIVKRGEYDRLGRYESELSRIMRRVPALNLPRDEKAALQEDLEQYGTLVKSIGTSLRENAPQLKAHHAEILRRLGWFNKKLGSIGLAELLKEWRELSRIKNRFVKKPSRSLAEQFGQTWTSVTIMITELYLDEEMEEPLFDYLERYKAYFSELSRAYETVGYRDVAGLKPLSYKIKMQLQMVVGAPSAQR
jgi:hypothetical protein